MILGALLTHGATAACILDRDGRCLQVSPNFSAITGIAPGQCFQFGLMQHFSEADQASLRAACATSSQMQREDPAEPQCFVSLSGGDAAVQALEWKLLPAESGMLQLVVLVRDITGEWQAARAAEAAETRAAIAEKGRSDFLANMSHELRTPLNAVLGFAQMMEAQIYGRIQNPTYRDYVKKIQESGQDLLHKITDLLHVSNLDAASARDVVAPLGTAVPLNALMREVIESFTHQAFRKDMRIQPILLDAGPVAMVERLELYGAIAQLMSNAVKFGTPGSLVQMVCRAHRDKSVSLHVLDRGTGISAPLLGRINQSLKRPLIERGRDDIGLGLAVAAEYMRRHGGTIQLKARSDGGSEAILTLPRQRIRWESVAEARTPEGQASEVGVARRKDDALAM